nr:phospholipase-like protein [Tanacetum cinerariifolium]
MSTLLELSSIAKSNDLKDMVVVLFESENEKDLMTANSMNIIAEYLATRVRERDLLIGELDICLGSTTAYESSKLLREKNDAGLAKARDRVSPHRVGLTITILDLLGVINDEEYFSKLCDVDAIRVCLLLCLDVIFMGRLLVTGVDDILMGLVDSLESWNAFPWGEHIWMHLYDEIINDSNPIFDLRPTLAEYKSEWWTSTNDFLQVYVPRNPIRKPDIFNAYLQKVSAGRKRNRLCRLISTLNTNVPRSNISSVKDSIIKELTSRIFKLEAIIQAFLEMFESSIIDSVGTPLDANTQEEVDEERLNEEEIRVRLEEQKRLRLEEDRVLEVKKKWEEDYMKRSYAFMNYDHMKQAMTPCAPKKRSHYVAVRRIVGLNATDNIWISEDLDIYLGKPGHLRCKFSWSKEHIDLWVDYMWHVRPNDANWAMVSSYFVKLLLQNAMPLWYVNGVRYSIAWTKADKFVAEFDILSGVVTFYDSGDNYNFKCCDWYIWTRDCLQVRLPEVLELLNVLENKGIDKRNGYDKKDKIRAKPDKTEYKTESVEKSTVRSQT